MASYSYCDCGYRTSFKLNTLQQSMPPNIRLKSIVHV